MLVKCKYVAPRSVVWLLPTFSAQSLAFSFAPDLIPTVPPSPVPAPLHRGTGCFLRPEGTLPCEHVAAQSPGSTEEDLGSLPALLHGVVSPPPCALPQAITCTCL